MVLIMVENQKLTLEGTCLGWLGSWMLNLCRVRQSLMELKLHKCGCLLFKVNIVYTYMVGYGFFHIITNWNIFCKIITRFFLYSPFPQAILMQKDTINNAILLTFASDGYLLIGET